MSEGHIAPSRAYRGNRYLWVSLGQAKSGISITSDLLRFVSPLRPMPYPRSRTDSWFYGRGTDGEPLFVGVAKIGEG